MKKGFYHSHNNNFFVGKKAIVLRTVKSNGGTIINENEKVTIKDKFRGFKISTDDFRVISRVNYEEINLI